MRSINPINVLIVCSDKSRWAQTILHSEYLNKLYLTSSEEIEGAVTIKFNTFKELAAKCKVLEIDIVLVEDAKFILEGIANVMKKNYINCFAPTTTWTSLVLSETFARNLLQKYGISIPQKIYLPSEFPVLVKGKSISKKADSLREIINIKENLHKLSPELAKTIYLEKYLNGEKIEVVSIFDGKHLLTFPNSKINSRLLAEYSMRLEKMLVSENADFIGFLSSELIEEDGKLYNTGFSFDFKIPSLSQNIPPKPRDVLYICLMAIYQKLNEINL